MLRKVVTAGSVILFIIVVTVLYAGTIGSTNAFSQCDKKVEKASSCAKSAAAAASSKQSAKACKASAKAACSQEGEKCCPAKYAKAAAVAIKKVATTIAERDSKRLVLTGEYICGKCSLSKLDFCQGFLKTSDGDLFPLVKNSNVNKMKKIMHGQNSVKFKTVSTVRLLNGVKYLEVKNFKII